jgi:hypothetical protein
MLLLLLSYIEFKMAKKMNCSENIYKNWFKKISKKRCNQLNQNNRENSENKLGFYDASNNIFYEV